MHLFYEVLFQRSIVIAPISVPRDMQDNGYTPDVAALHLRDALNKYAEHVHTSATGPEMALDKDLSGFVIPTVGLSFEAVAAQIRTFFRIERRQNISGEFTRVDENLQLRLRKNAAVIFQEGRMGTDAKTLEALFAEAAPAIFAATSPYFEAVAKSESTPGAAAESAKKIIARSPTSDWNVVWAHNLLGSLHHRKHMLDAGTGTGAIAEFKWVIDHDPHFAVAHLNLGLAYNEQGRTQDAINEFRAALSIDPGLSGAHMYLGDTLDQLSEIEAARCEYFEAIAKSYQAVVSNPLSAVAHHRLGTALKKRGKAEKADCGTFFASICDILGIKRFCWIGNHQKNILTDFFTMTVSSTNINKRLRSIRAMPSSITIWGSNYFNVRIRPTTPSPSFKKHSIFERIQENLMKLDKIY